MKIDCISDLHGQLPSLNSGDILIIAGDLTYTGSKGEMLMFNQWLKHLYYKDIIVIAGNHDRYLTQQHKFLDNAHYLCDQSIEIQGLKFHGSPYTVKFMDWYFGKDDNKLIEHWKKIPEGLDFLITHGPPKHILDLSDEGIPCGSKTLLDRIRVCKPKYHIFGHIHEGYGHITSEGTEFYNVSLLNENYKMVNPVTVIRI